MENIKRKPITLSPTEGSILSVVGDTYRILANGKQTNGTFAIIDMLIPPDGGPGPHAHKEIEECFYVIDGEIEVKSEFGDYTASQGSFVYIPPGGVIHSFKNNTSKIAHLLCMVVPSGLEAFFEEIGSPVEPGEFLPAPPIDQQAAKTLEVTAAKYGQSIYPPNYLDVL